MICQQCNGIYYFSGPKQDRRMNRKEKQIQNCGCISATTINTPMTTARARMLSLDPVLMWKNKGNRKVSKEFEGH